MKPIALKILALIFGTSLWYIFSQSHHDTMSIDVPVCFYDADKNIQLETPETIRVTLTGKRSDLVALELEHLAVHLDASKLNAKSSRLTIEAQHLFLPATIKLVHYSPAPVPVHVTLQGNQL